MFWLLCEDRVELVGCAGSVGEQVEADGGEEAPSGVEVGAQTLRLGLHGEGPLEAGAPCGALAAEHERVVGVEGGQE